MPLTQRRPRAGRRLTLYLGLLRSPVGAPPPPPSGYLTLGCLPPWSPEVTQRPRARARGVRRPPGRPVDNLPDPVGNLWNMPNTPDGSPTVNSPSPILAPMTGQVPPDPVRELRPAEVQRLLGVGRTTLHEYESTGRLRARRTLGGHRRYPADQPALRELLAAPGGDQ